MSVKLFEGDCRAVLETVEPSSFDACITDPPYELAFMGRDWDRSGVAFSPDTWRLVYDALKPGAHLLAFGGSRTFARMFCAIEDAGFEYRDTLMWLYGTGFPKSHDIAQAIDREAGYRRERVDNPKGGYHGGLTGAQDKWTRENGATRSDKNAITPEAQQWAGWGTALKPAFEPIGMFRKPLDNCTVAANVLKHGTGAINIDACRVETADNLNGGRYSDNKRGDDGNTYGSGINLRSANDYQQPTGRWPANCLHDGSEEVEAAFAAFGERASGNRSGEYTNGTFSSGTVIRELIGSTGTASRFYYSAKASKADRAGSKHPTVKPLAPMRWLVRLVTPPGGTVLDCFAGSGTTGEAAMLEGFNAILVEQDATYCSDIRRRLNMNLEVPNEPRRSLQLEIVGLS